MRPSKYPSFRMWIVFLRSLVSGNVYPLAFASTTCSASAQVYCRACQYAQAFSHAGGALNVSLRIFEFVVYIGRRVLPLVKVRRRNLSHILGRDRTTAIIVNYRGLYVVQSGRVVILVIKVAVGFARVRRSAQESVELASFELGFAGIGFPRNASGFDGSTGFVGFAGIGSQRRASGFDKSTGFVGFVALGSSAEPRFLMGALHMWIFAGFAALPRM